MFWEYFQHVIVYQSPGLEFFIFIEIFLGMASGMSESRPFLHTFGGQMVFHLTDPLQIFTVCSTNEY